MKGYGGTSDMPRMGHRKGDGKIALVYWFIVMVIVSWLLYKDQVRKEERHAPLSVVQSPAGRL